MAALMCVWFGLEERAGMTRTKTKGLFEGGRRREQKKNETVWL